MMEYQISRPCLDLSFQRLPCLNHEGVLVNMACCMRLLRLICVDLLTCLTTCKDRQVHNNYVIRKRQLQNNLFQFHLLEWHADMISQVVYTNDLAEKFPCGYVSCWEE